MKFANFASGLFNFLKRTLLNKYVLVLASFGVYITFFDTYNLISRWETSLKMKELKRQYEYYEQEISKNREQFKRLKTDDAYLEQFAREKYLMRNKGEEIYIVKE